MIFGTKFRDGWQRWYAWRPVRIYTGEWVWLDYVERAKWYGSKREDVYAAWTQHHISGFFYVYRIPSRSALEREGK